MFTISGQQCSSRGDEAQILCSIGRSRVSAVCFLLACSFSFSASSSNSPSSSSASASLAAPKSDAGGSSSAVFNFCLDRAFLRRRPPMDFALVRARAECSNNGHVKNTYCPGFSPVARNDHSYGSARRLNRGGGGKRVRREPRRGRRWQGHHRTRLPNSTRPHRSRES